MLLVKSPPASPLRGAGRHVALIGLGPSAESYVDLTKRLGGRKAYCDEVWCINGMGDVLACDRVIHMDDLRIQEARAAAAPHSNIAHMIAWMRTTATPIITSTAYADYPASVEFPVQAFIDANIAPLYANSTAAWAVMLAVLEGFDKISIFGFDFTYPNSHHAEKGRACVEFWLGVAAARGILVLTPHDTTLFDSVEGRPIYGYGALGARDLVLDDLDDPNVPTRVRFVARDALPSAAEVEAAYDHTKHPNPLVKEPSNG